MMLRRHAKNLLLALPLAGSAFAWSGSAAAASTTLSELFNDAIHGGVVVDGFSAETTTATFKSGSVIVDIPSGAKVRQAWLVSITGNVAYAIPAVPGTPRQVILGSGANATTVTIEGNPQFPSAADSLGYGAWVTEVTTKLQAIVGTSTGTPVSVPIQERGDGPSDFLPSIYGHTLIVVYDLASAPLRNVFAGGGILGGPTITPDVTQTVKTKRPIVKCVGASATDPFPLSVSVVDDYDSDNGVIKVNGTDMSVKVGGTDDKVDPNGAQELGLFSAGSFSAKGPTGAPLGITKTLNGVSYTDSITAKPAAIENRTDDELYDMASAVTLGGDTIAIRYVSPSSGSAMGAIAFQTGAGGAGGCDTVAPAGCTDDASCNATQFCDDGLAPAACTGKLPNGSALPAGGKIGGKCTPAAAQRACVSGKCETRDDKCGLADGSVCAVGAECRSGTCTGSVCLTPTTPDAGTPKADAGTADGGAIAFDGQGSVEGGGFSCTTRGGSSAPSLFTVACAAGLAIGAATRRRRRK
jgi:hypothetical protein